MYEISEYKGKLSYSLKSHACLSLLKDLEF